MRPCFRKRCGADPQVGADYSTVPMRRDLLAEWWNWQTRRLEGAVSSGCTGSSPVFVIKGYVWSPCTQKTRFSALFRCGPMSGERDGLKGLIPFIFFRFRPGEVLTVELCVSDTPRKGRSSRWLDVGPSSIKSEKKRPTCHNDKRHNHGFATGNRWLILKSVADTYKQTAFFRSVTQVGQGASLLTM